ncbi:flagellar filament capping protein FliD [uncultured Paraglaciecola sp.]|uniref:flagellar filament capping protein FliD n=1 Tax=uncultured Paraglaciecola sp. TaxID=1765024 RepID=UPI0025EBE4E2|nr:flagellar filament capping protein FliD [uncultured Paraglaciecola sp.]
MAITSSLGIGSGMDINAIVSQLVQVEGQPAYGSIERKESAANDRLSALGRLKSSLSDFRTATGKLNELGSFSAHKVSSANEDVLTATADLGAATGSYSMEVQQLAEAHKLTSKGYSGYSDIVGSGALTLSVGGNDFSVTLDATNNTLQGVRDAINQAGDNTGVNASIINVDDGVGGTVSKLVLTSKETGTANNISITAVEDPAVPGLSSLVYDPAGTGVTNLTEQNEAQDAKVFVDGQLATRSSNSIDDIIQGVTLDLKTAEIGGVFNLDVTLDEESIKEVAEGFVSAYNGLMSIVKDLGKFDAEGEGSGALIGDSTLRNVQTQIRQAVSDTVSSATTDYDSLATIGITMDRDGVMSLNSTDFSNALKSNINAVSDVFSSRDGVAARLDTRLDQYLNSGGTFDLQTKSLNKQLSKLSDERDTVALRLDNLERTLMKQFIAMDVTVGRFQSTGAYLASQLANL